MQTRSCTKRARMQARQEEEDKQPQEEDKKQSQEQEQEAKKKPQEQEEEEGKKKSQETRVDTAMYMETSRCNDRDMTELMYNFAEAFCPIFARTHSSFHMPARGYLRVSLCNPAAFECARTEAERTRIVCEAMNDCLELNSISRIMGKLNCVPDYYRPDFITDILAMRANRRSFCIVFAAPMQKTDVEVCYVYMELCGASVYRVRGPHRVRVL